MAKSSDASKATQISKPSGMVAMVTAPGGPRRRAGLDFGKAVRYRVVCQNILGAQSQEVGDVAASDGTAT